MKGPYVPPAEYIARQLAAVPAAERPRKRLEIDIAALLTGPTSGHNGDRLARCLVGSEYGEDRGEAVAHAMRDAADRYLAAIARPGRRPRAARAGSGSGAVYCTSYCNRGHDLATGKPIGHECHILPPAALQAEREGRASESIAAIERAKPLRTHRGLKGGAS